MSSAVPVAELESRERPHEFGSVHTLIKLQTIAAYMTAYTTALKNLRFRLHYIDAFAGTGECSVKVGGQRLTVPGSAKIAAECKPGFDRLVLIEKSRPKARALQRLKADYPESDIEVVNDDANVALPACVRALQRLDRAIAFLDPFGMSVNWPTLEQIARSKIVDVWYLFPLSGLYRQATLKASDMDEDKVAALDRIFGTHEWYDAFYDAPAQGRLFGEAGPDERTADVTAMVSWVKGRLRTIFAEVAEPKILWQTRPGGKRGAPIFALFFAVSNPSPAARGLAMKIAKSVLKD